MKAQHVGKGYIGRLQQLDDKDRGTGPEQVEVEPFDLEVEQPTVRQFDGKLAHIAPL